MLKEGGTVRMVMDREGWWRTMNFPSSTMEMRWPIPGDGYSTTVFIDISITQCYSHFGGLRVTILISEAWL